MAFVRARARVYRRQRSGYAAEYRKGFHRVIRPGSGPRTRSPARKARAGFFIERTGGSPAWIAQGETANLLRGVGHERRSAYLPVGPSAAIIRFSIYGGELRISGFLLQGHRHRFRLPTPPPVCGCRLRVRHESASLGTRIRVPPAAPERELHRFDPCRGTFGDRRLVVGRLPQIMRVSTSSAGRVYTPARPAGLAGTARGGTEDASHLCG